MMMVVATLNMKALQKQVIKRVNLHPPYQDIVTIRESVPGDEDLEQNK